MTEPSDSPTPTTPPSPKPQGGVVTFLLVSVFRLLLLGVGGSMAFVGGIAIAFIYPDPNPETPWIEQVLQRPFQPFTPQWWQGSPPARLSALSPQQRQQGTQELIQLKSDLDLWRDRLTILEAKLSQPFPQKAIEARLRLLEQQLSGQSSAIANIDRSFLVTLPSDLLFLDDRIALDSKQSDLLNGIIAELRNYPNSVVLINAYTDNIGDARENLELSLQQANSVHEYLYIGLGDGYRFLRVGYGETRSLVANDSDIQRQRNRRVEILIQ